MGLLFVDGFDHYATVTQKWPNNVGGAIGAYGRFGTNGMRFVWIQNYVWRSIGSNYGTIYAGVAAKADTPWTLLKFVEGTSTQFCLYVDGAGHLCAYRGNLANLLATSTLTVDASVYHYYEVKVVFSTTVGQVTAKVDGVEFLNTPANLNTCATGNAYINGVGFAGTGNSGCTIDYDDFYVADDAFQGDCRIISAMPSGAGNYAQWDPSAGANYACVDETPPVTTDYVSTTVLNEIDTYAMADISPTVGTVKAVVGNYYVQKTDAGSRQIGMTTRLASTDLVSTGQAVPSSWGFLQFIQETKPGGGAWSVQDTKDAEMGMKLTV